MVVSSMSAGDWNAVSRMLGKLVGRAGGGLVGWLDSKEGSQWVS